MSSVTITVNELSNFLRDNSPLLSDDILYKSPNGGGFKILTYGGNRLYIVVEGTVHRMRYGVKDKIAMEISEESHAALGNLTKAIHRVLDISTRDISYEGADGYEGYWLRGQITGYEDKFFTRVYGRLSQDSVEYEEISIENCPSSFRGYVCLEVRGVFIKSLKDRDSELFLRNEFSELVIEERDVSTTGGSRIMKLLGGTVVSKNKNSIKNKEDSEEVLW